MTFPIYYCTAIPSGPAAHLEAALAHEDPTGGENHQTNGMMWAALTKLLKPIDPDKFWELHAFISKTAHTFPFAVSISKGGDNNPAPPASLEDTVFIWGSGDDDDDEMYGEGSGDLMVALTPQCIFIHDAAHWSTVEKLVGFAVLHSIPMVAGPHFNFVCEHHFTGYELPEKAKPSATLHMFDGGKKSKKPEKPAE